MLLTDKYFPKCAEEIIGQDNSIKRLREFILKNKHSLIYGSNGVGKTSSVYAIASELNSEIIELNASDFRTKNDIENILGNSIRQKSLFKKNKIILIDEIDWVTGEDRGGIQAVNELLDNNNFPIVITGNEIFDSKFNAIRKKCNIIEFKKLDRESILKILEKICKEENLKYNRDILKKISYMCDGDARAAINDLQSLTFDKEVLDLELYDREKKEDIFNILKIIFKTSDNKNLYRIFDRIDMNFDELFLWLDENIVYEYSDKALMNAYNYLSLADIFRGRIKNKQYYRFLVYVNLFLGCGVADSKENINSNIIKYKRSERPLKIWISNRKNFEKIRLAEDLSKELHLSKKKLIKELNFMKFYFMNNDI